MSEEYLIFGFKLTLQAVDHHDVTCVKTLSYSMVLKQN
jgi:hypothetical protein